LAINCRIISDKEEFNLLYILGSGHCGSTLLDLLLNGHPDILGLGQVVDLKRYIASLKNDRSHPQGNPLCGSLWQEAIRRYEATSSNPFDRIEVSHPRWKELTSWNEEEIARWAESNKTLYSSLQQASGAKVLTDSSKVPHRLCLLWKSGLFDIKVIHLVRDGRAVVNSYLRKHGSFTPAVRGWAFPTLLAYYLHRNFAEDNWLQVRYEELATRPEETLKRICAFLGIYFVPKMLAYKSHAYIGLAGNRLRHREEERIFLDQCWHKELRFKHRLAFALSAGWLNKLYGYGYY